MQNFQAKLIGINQNWRRHKILSFVIAITAFFCFLLKISIFPLIQFYFKLPGIPVLMSIRLYYFEFFRMLYVVQFIMASLALQVRFRKLNENLEITRSDFDGKDALNIARLYHMLCDLAELLNATFSFHFIAIFANLLVKISSHLHRRHRIVFHQLTIIFGFYGIIVAISRPSAVSIADVGSNITSSINAWFLIAIVVFFGSSLTSEASRTVNVFSKFMSTTNFYYTQKQDLVYLLSQLRSRKVEVRNFLFKIDWHVIVAVSFSSYFWKICNSELIQRIHSIQ